MAAGDVKVSTDNGTSSNITTLPVIGTNTRVLKVNLSASEMNGDNVTVIFSDAAGAEWCDLVLNIQTSARQIDDLATPTNITAGTITTVTNLTNLPAITANWLTAAGTAADFGAEMATAIWTDTVAGDFTAALSVGKSIMNGVALGTGLTINAYTGNTVQTGDSFARIGAAGAGLTAIDLPDQTMNITGNITGNLSGSVGSVTSVAPIAAAVWDEDATGHQTQGTFGQAIGDPAADTNTIYKAVVTDAAGATVGVDVVAVKAETASIQSDTNDLQTQVGTAGDGLTNINLPNQTMDIVGNITGNLSGSVGSVTGLTTSTIADKILARTISGGADGGRTVTSTLRAIRNKVAISGGTMTVYEEDDTTTAYTAAVTTAAGDPISSIDPT
jgi:hypothetical protein